MPDHLHALANPGGMNIIRWTGAFKSYSTRRAHDAGMAGLLWQPGFYDRRIRDEQEMDSTRYYIWKNPVEAGLVAAPEQWRWTFLREPD